mgnify:CR=1 FL=1
MLELKYDNKVHLDKWDIDVVPYITMENMGSIINDLLTCQNGLEREMRLMADVLVSYTDLFTDKDAKYEYEQIMYTGLWDDILDACPYIREGVEKINREVKETLSVEKSLMQLIDTATLKLQELDVDLTKVDTEKIIEALKPLINIGE